MLGSLNFFVKKKMGIFSTSASTQVLESVCVHGHTKLGINIEDKRQGCRKALLQFIY